MNLFLEVVVALAVAVAACQLRQKMVVGVAVAVAVEAEVTCPQQLAGVGLTVSAVAAQVSFHAAPA